MNLSAKAPSFPKVSAILYYLPLRTISVILLIKIAFVVQNSTLHTAAGNVFLTNTLLKFFHDGQYHDRKFRDVRKCTQLFLN